MEQETKQKLDEILELVHFIKDNAATQESVNDLKGEFNILKNEMHAGFASIRSELRAVRDELEDIKKRLTALEKCTKDDDNAMANVVIKLKDEIKKLENRVKTLELART